MGTQHIVGSAYAPEKRRAVKICRVWWCDDVGSCSGVCYWTEWDLAWRYCLMYWWIAALPIIEWILSTFDMLNISSYKLNIQEASSM